MRLLNLSDIHFREPDCLNSATDPDVPFRTRLTNDLVSCVAQAGKSTPSWLAVTSRSRAMPLSTKLRSSGSRSLQKNVGVRRTESMWYLATTTLTAASVTGR